MILLPDVNVLVALAWPNHVHHEAAHSWFAQARAGWATCPVTESGFVRVSCNPAAVKQAVAPTDAIAQLGRMSRRGAHSFWAMDRSIVALPEGILARIQGYRQITDAVLLALAVQHGGQLATLDAGIADLLAEPELRSVFVIPV